MYQLHIFGHAIYLKINFSHCVRYKVTKKCLNTKVPKGHFVTNRPNLLTNGTIIKTKTPRC